MLKTRAGPRHGVPATLLTCQAGRCPSLVLPAGMRTGRTAPAGIAGRNATPRAMQGTIRRCDGAGAGCRFAAIPGMRKRALIVLLTRIPHLPFVLQRLVQDLEDEVRPENVQR